MKILNTSEIISALTVAFSYRQIAKMLNTTTPTVRRWEEGETLASMRFDVDFNRAIRRLEKRFEQHPKVARAIRESLRIRSIA